MTKRRVGSRIKKRELTSCRAILNKQKCHFFSPKMENRKQSRSCVGVDTIGRREDIRKGCRRVNMV
jgi:hypothetical protein